MKIVLIQNVHGLGKIDEIKEVADGYANNYLFTKNLAIPASKKMLADLQMKRDKQKKDVAKDLQNKQAVATRLDGYELEIKEKVSKTGSLYASMSTQKLVKALQKKGFSVDQSQIEMPHIKEVGVYQIKIKFDHGLEAKVSLTVLAE
ncbi:MAG: 50S ribosomal protein L9 [bacterium]